MRYLALLLNCAGILIILWACKQTIPSNCQPVSESVYINNRFPTHIEQYHPDSLRIFIFEYDFLDSVTVSVGSQVAAKGYITTKSNGLAGRLLVKAQSNEEITIYTTNGCARFSLKEGYKYLYINRTANKNWEVAYSNFSRGYF